MRLNQANVIPVLLMITSVPCAATDFHVDFPGGQSNRDGYGFVNQRPAELSQPFSDVWMQGESDAHYTAEIAERAQTHLRRLMDLIRAAFRADDLPVVIGRISCATKEPLNSRPFKNRAVTRS